MAVTTQMNGERLFQAVTELAPQKEQMGRAARVLARPGATQRVADILEELIDTGT